MRKSPLLILSALSVVGLAALVQACGEDDATVETSADAGKDSGKPVTTTDSSTIGDDSTGDDDAALLTDDATTRTEDGSVTDSAVMTDGSSVTDSAVDSGPVDSGYCPQIPDLVAWWKGDGDTTNEMGLPQGLWSPVGAAYGTGKVGMGLSFDGIAAAYVQAADSPALDLTGGLTVDAWINIPSAITGRIVDKITSGGSDGWLLDVVGGKLRVIAGGYAATATAALPTGALVHVAGTWATGSVPKLYVNGVLAAVTTAGTTGPVDTALPVRIGADQAGTNRFTGIIDEVGIYSRALTGTEVTDQFNTGSTGRCATRYPVSVTVSGLIGQVSLSNSGGDNVLFAGNGAGPFAKKIPSGGTYKVEVVNHPVGQRCTVENGSGTVTTAAITNVTVTCARSYVQLVKDTAPVAYFPFDDQSSAANTLKDVIAGYQGTITGGVTTNVTGLVRSGKAVTFNGTSGKIDVPYAAALNPNSDFSVEAWASTPLAAGNGPAEPWSIVTSRGTFTGYMFYFVPSTNGAYAQWGNAGAWTATTYAGTNTVPRDTRHHYVMVHVLATKTTLLYIDGVQYATLAAANAFTPNAAQPFRIGSGATEGAGNFYFNGTIDDVAFYNTALSAGVIQGHYNTGRNEL